MRALINGGPAFPATTHNDSDMNNRDEFGSSLPPDRRQTYPGMTLRDYFAGQALAGLCANEYYAVGMDKPSRFVQITRRAYEYADAMLKARDAE